MVAKSNSVQTWLTDKLTTNLIQKFQWPPRSLDLNQRDFFLWRYLKARVHIPMPQKQKFI